MSWKLWGFDENSWFFFLIFCIFWFLQGVLIGGCFSWKKKNWLAISFWFSWIKISYVVMLIVRSWSFGDPWMSTSLVQNFSKNNMHYPVLLIVQKVSSFSWDWVFSYHWRKRALQRRKMPNLYLSSAECLLLLGPDSALLRKAGLLLD